MSESKYDPDTPPEEKLPLVATPEGQNALAAAALSAAERAADTEDFEEVDAAMGEAVEPDVVDPTAEDLEGIELDDTEDRDG